MSQQSTDLDYVRHAALGNDSDRKLIAEAFLQAAATCLRKNADYGSSVFESPILAPGMNSQSAILVRISDKIKRMRNLFGVDASPQVDESIEDTALDAAAYAVLLIVARRKAKTQGEWEAASESQTELIAKAVATGEIMDSCGKSPFSRSKINWVERKQEISELSKTSWHIEGTPADAECLPGPGLYYVKEGQCPSHLKGIWYSAWHCQDGKFCPVGDPVSTDDEAKYRCREHLHGRIMEFENQKPELTTTLIWEEHPKKGTILRNWKSTANGLSFLIVDDAGESPPIERFRVAIRGEYGDLSSTFFETHSLAVDHCHRFLDEYIRENKNSSAENIDTARTPG